MAEKQKVCKKSSARDSATNGSASFTFVNGTVLTVNKADIPADLIDVAMFHGISQKVGDAYAGAAGDVDSAIESAQSVIERLLAGEWLAEREAAGPRPSLVADAVIAAKKLAGLPFDEAATRAKYIGKDSADNRKRALENVQVKAEYDRIRAEAAMARADESAKKAAGTTANVADL